MANEFGDEEIEQLSTNEFGDIAVSTSAPLLPRGTIPEEVEFAESRFTPSQQAALGALGPLGAIFGATARGPQVTQTEAFAEAGLEQMGRLPAEVGGMMARGFAPLPLKLLAPNLLEEAISKATQPALQLPETIETALGLPPTPERAVFREPEAAAFGEIGASLLPLGAITPGTAVTAVKSGLEAITPTLPSRMLARGFRTPTIEKATGLLRGVEEGKLGEILSQAPPRIIEETGGKLIKTGDQAIRAGDRAAETSFNEAINFIKQAEQSGYAAKGDVLLAAGKERVLGTFDSLRDQPEALEAIFARPVFQKLKGDVSPSQAQKSLKELNTEWDRFVDKKSPEALAYKSIRDGLADQLDDIVKLTSGKNIQPYRDWGNIKEFTSGIRNRLEETRQAAGREAVPVTSESPLGAATTARGQVVGAVARGLKKLTRPLIKQGQEFVDEGVAAVFKDSPKRLARENLPEDAISGFRQYYLKKPPQIVPETAIVPPPPLPVAVPTFEEQVQATIKLLPKNMRGQGERNIAEAIVKSQTAPTPAVVAPPPINPLQQAIAETVQTPLGGINDPLPGDIGAPLSIAPDNKLAQLIIDLVNQGKREEALRLQQELFGRR